MSQQNNKREIRVFLSSTFRDMDAERTHLIKQVFPKVRAACLERQVGFSEIDLRWGVTEDESKNGATVEICLKEIARCRDFPPFFVGFLGERYGWVPRQDELAAYWEKHSGSDYAPAILQAIERGISVTELEMELAVLGEGAAEKMAGHALFCLRDPTLTDQLYQAQTGKAPDHTDPAFYDAGNGKLDILKHQIRQSGYLGLDNYTSVEQFGAAIESYLLAQLDRLYPADEVPTPLARSNTAHAGFRFHRLQNFLQRTDVREQMIQAIEQRLETPALGPILVAGPSGQGKSALMADLARHYQTAHQQAASPTETWRVFDHYIGADHANHLEDWVDRILQTLHPDIQDIAGDIPESHKDKLEALSTWISMAARRHNCRYLFILDALDQLGDGGKNLDILTPQTLGPDGILIASAANDTPAISSTANWQTRIDVPPLTDALRTQLVTDTLARYRKTLPDDLASKLAGAPQSGSPLYLGLALEELRVDARHETLATLIDDILAQPDAEHLFLNNFLLDADNGRPEMPELAARFMALLGASRAGLSEIELADLLAQPEDPIAADTGKPRLPQIHLSKLLNNLAPFLLNKGGNRAPMHRIFGEAALGHYDTAPIREHLYAHFAPGYGKGEDEFNARGAAEALFQITELAKLDQTKQTQARKQLIEDLGHLPIPVKLHDNEANGGGKLILDALDALDALGEIRQAELQQAWAKEIARLNGKEAAQFGPPIRDFGRWLKYWARYPLALAVLEPLMNQQETLLPEDHGEIADTSDELGTLYHDLAKFDRAAPLLRRALAIRESTLGPEHPATAASLNNLASLLQSQGNYAEAEPLYRRAFAIWEKALGPEHPLTATSLNNLGGLLQSLGNYAEAEPLKRRSLVIMEKHLGPEHQDTATALNNLAVLLSYRGNYNEAEPLHRRALAIREKTFGPKHRFTAESIENLASLLSLQGSFSNAELLFRRALAIWEKTFGPEHPNTATSLSNLAEVLAAGANFADAEPLHRRALAIREKTLGPEHQDTAISLHNIAALLRTMGNTAEAEPLCLHSLTILEKVFGPEHPATATALNTLAFLLAEEDKYEEAEPLFRRVLAINEQALGPEHPHTATSLNNLAGLLEAQGETPEAGRLYPRALAIFEKVFGPKHPSTIETHRRLAVCLREMGQFSKAETLLKQVLDDRCRTLGELHEDTLLVQSGLGKFYRLMDKVEEAHSTLNDALDKAVSALGKGHAVTLGIQEELDLLPPMGSIGENA